MTHRIQHVTPQADFTLLLAFDNGEQRQFDVKPHLHKGVFVALQQYDTFRLVKSSGSAIEWPDEIDLCADMLYEQSELVSRPD
jgi:Protein of unknown function (DUF2442)